jgi:hypothetical protein
MVRLYHFNKWTSNDWNVFSGCPTIQGFGRAGFGAFSIPMTKEPIGIDPIHQRRELDEQPTPRKRRGVEHLKLKPASKARPEGTLLPMTTSDDHGTLYWSIENADAQQERKTDTRDRDFQV